jgi:hypothetical protein
MFAVCNWRRAKREREHLVISLWHLEILVLFFPNFEFAFCFMSGMRLRENRIELKTLDGGKNRENNGVLQFRNSWFF